MTALIGATAASSRLDRSPRWVREAARTKAIPAVKVGSQWKFDPDELDAWIDSQRNRPPLAYTALSQKRQELKSA